jgi:hypothetical protein
MNFDVCLDVPRLFSASFCLTRHFAATIIHLLGLAGNGLARAESDRLPMPREASADSEALQVRSNRISTSLEGS